MRIEINNKKNTIPFEKIKDGEVFLLSGSYLMKITPIIDENNNAHNAVDLRTGAAILVNPTIKYEPVAATLKYEPVAATLKINFDNPTTTVAERKESKG